MIFNGREPGAARVVHVLREEYDIYVGREMARYELRGSIWANSYKIGELFLPPDPRSWEIPYVGRRLGRQDVLKLHAAQVRATPDLEIRLPELRDRVLACWCKPRRGFGGRWLCHGQTLLGLAHGVPPETIG